MAQTALFLTCTEAGERLVSVTYSTFSWPNAIKQLVHALRSDAANAEHVAVVAERLRRDRKRMESILQGPLRGKRILEIGPGQHMTRACILAIDNHVTAVDQDVIPQRLSDYLRMAQANGFSRVLKTFGRKVLLVDLRHRRALSRALGVDSLPRPRFLATDFCQLPDTECFDAVCSWSVFEHLPDPEAAMHGLLSRLAPGGAFLISVHLYTSHTGHHDIRSFTGSARSLPLWGHLRPRTQHLITPSAYLNHYRLSQWRDLFQRLVPDVKEYQERLGEAGLRARMTPELRKELGAYADEELFTVDVIFVGRKPHPEAETQPPSPKDCARTSGLLY